MPIRLLAILLFTLMQFFPAAQDEQKIAGFNNKIALAPTDNQRVMILGELADYYFTYRLEKKADSVLQKQINLATLSHDKELVLAALFSNSINNLPTWTSNETFDRTLSFIQQGLDYARELGRDDYIALAYIRKACLLRKRGQYDNAIQQATLAFSAIGNAPLDSIKAILNLELAEIYLAKNDAASAYRNLNNAYDLAYNLKNVPLQSKTLHQFADLYQYLGNKDLARSNLLQSLELNASHGLKSGMLNDYIDLARFTDDKEYINKGLLLSDTLQLERQKMFCKKLMFSYYMVVDKNIPQSLQYFKSNPDLQQFYRNVSPANYWWTIGNVYKYSNKPDSAILYYQKAEPELERSFDVITRRSMYKELGEAYAMLHQPKEAIVYYERALQLARQIQDIGSLSSLSLQLSKMYAATMDFKKSYEYTQDYLNYKDSLQKLSAARDVVLLEVERENRRREKDALELDMSIERKRNLQYMAITIAISSLFLFMILIGMFPVSKFTIKALGYFAFICLFEFLVLLIDSFLHRITHGEPLKTWLIKIFLIALLVPFQHFLEHGLTKFLASRKLVEMRSRISIRHWRESIKRPVSNIETGIEQDTAVL